MNDSKSSMPNHLRSTELSTLAAPGVPLTSSDMRICIDGTPLFGPRTGIGHYTANLCRALSRIAPSLQLQFFCGMSWSSEMPGDLSGSNGKVARRAIFFMIDRGVRLFGPWLAIFRKQVFTRAERLIFAHGLAKYQPQVVHATGGFIHRTHVPTVITVHDISCFRHPETHPYARVHWQRKTLPASIEHAQRILTVSEFTRQELIEYFGVDPSKVVVTHNGVDTTFHPRPSIDVDTVIRKFGLAADSYVLSVGTLEPRKNLETLVAAHERLPKALATRYPLVVVGMRGWKESSLVRRLRPLVAQGRVRVLGYVPQDLLPFLYCGARAFAYPSIYEGFGLPPLEAMASGVPVAVSNASSLPEVVGDSGLLVTPHDVEAWTQTLQRILLDEDFRSTATAHGLARAGAFSWEQCAKLTLDAYRDLVANPSEALPTIHSRSQ